MAQVALFVTPKSPSAHHQEVAAALSQLGLDLIYSAKAGKYDLVITVPDNDVMTVVRATDAAGPRPLLILEQSGRDGFMSEGRTYAAYYSHSSELEPVVEHFLSASKASQAAAANLAN